jgi:hypothetical protein
VLYCCYDKGHNFFLTNSEAGIMQEWVSLPRHFGVDKFILAKRKDDLQFSSIGTIQQDH